MQNSSEFQYIAIDTIHESATNPRRTFDESKLHELGESIRTNGLIQPITVRPNSQGFEIVAGARRFRAAQLAELFSLPARIVGYQRRPGGRMAAGRELAACRRSPLRRSPGLPAAAGHARLRRSNTGREIRQERSPRLRPSVSPAAYPGHCGGVFWPSASPLPTPTCLPVSRRRHRQTLTNSAGARIGRTRSHNLLPAKHLSAWIQTNLYLSLADAPFDKDDPTLNPPAGACVTCPRRSGFNTSLFADVQGDQCLDAPCFHTKVNAHIDRGSCRPPGAYPDRKRIPRPEGAAPRSRPQRHLPRNRPHPLEPRRGTYPTMRSRKTRHHRLRQSA